MQTHEYAREYNRFLVSTGLYPVREYLENVYVQGDHPRVDPSTRSIYAFCAVEGLETLPDRDTEEPEIIKIETGRLTSAEKDIFMDVDDKKIKLKYVNEYGDTVAYVDTLGNLYMCDFYHNEARMPWAASLIREYIEIAAQRGIMDIISVIKTAKVREIVIEFDKEAYIKEVEKTVKEQLEKIALKYKALAESHIDTIKNQYTIKENTLKKRYRALESRIESERNSAFKVGVEIATRLPEGWKIDKWYDNTFLIYDKRIPVTHVKQNNRLYRVPPDLFYVNKIAVPIEEEVSKAYLIEGYHPNGKNDEEILCIGDLKGKPLMEVLEKLPESLKTANLDSAYSCGATAELEEMLENQELDEEGAVWSDEWTSEPEFGIQV